MLTNHSLHLVPDAPLEVRRDTMQTSPDEGWLTITLDGHAINIFGTHEQLDELAVKIGQSLSDSVYKRMVQASKGFLDPVVPGTSWSERFATPSYATPIDWDRMSEDDLALRGAYDDVMAEPWEYR